MSCSPSKLARSFVWAQEEARGLRHRYIGTEHILVGLLREEQGLAGACLSRTGSLSSGFVCRW